MGLPIKIRMKSWGIAEGGLSCCLCGSPATYLLPFLIGAGRLPYFLDPVADRLKHSAWTRAIGQMVINADGAADLC